MQQAEQFGMRMVEMIWGAIADSLNHWLSGHPIVQWLVLHPLLTLGFTVLILFLAWGLLGAVGRLTQNLWLTILQVPVRLLRLILQGLSILLSRLFQRAIALPMPDQSDEPSEMIPDEADNRLDHILTRLVDLQREQQELMTELADLLGNPPNASTHIDVIKRS